MDQYASDPQSVGATLYGVCVWSAVLHHDSRPDRMDQPPRDQ